MSFSGDIAKFSNKFEKRYRAVFRGSVEDVANLSNLSDDKGGRMRVDTGFLRASQAAAIGSMPTGPSKNETGGQIARRIGMSPAEALGRWQIGQTIFIGWTSNYARPREAKDGFMRGAAEKWPSIVDKNAAEAVRRGL